MELPRRGAAKSCKGEAFTESINANWRLAGRRCARSSNIGWFQLFKCVEVWLSFVKLWQKAEKKQGESFHLVKLFNCDITNG